MDYIFSIKFSSSGQNGIMIDEDVLGTEFTLYELKELRTYLNYVYVAASAGVTQDKAPDPNTGRLSVRVCKKPSERIATAVIEADDIEFETVSLGEVRMLLIELEDAIELVDYLDALSQCQEKEEDEAFERFDYELSKAEVEAKLAEALRGARAWSLATTMSYTELEDYIREGFSNIS